MADIQALNGGGGSKSHNSIHFLSSASFTNFTSVISRGQKRKLNLLQCFQLSALAGPGRDAGVPGRDAGVPVGCRLGQVGARLPAEQPPRLLGSPPVIRQSRGAAASTSAQMMPILKNGF